MHTRHCLGQTNRNSVLNRKVHIFLLLLRLARCIKNFSHKFSWNKWFLYKVLVLPLEVITYMEFFFTWNTLKATLLVHVAKVSTIGGLERASQTGSIEWSRDSEKGVYGRHLDWLTYLQLLPCLVMIRWRIFTYQYSPSRSGLKSFRSKIKNVHFEEKIVYMLTWATSHRFKNRLPHLQIKLS